MTHITVITGKLTITTEYTKITNWFLKLWKLDGETSTTKHIKGSWENVLTNYIHRLDVLRKEEIEKKTKHDLELLRKLK